MRHTVNGIWQRLLVEIFENGYSNQRDYALRFMCSLGYVNKELNDLISTGYLDDQYVPTLQAKEMLNRSRPQRAIILAAGFASRLVPINLSRPKALLKIHNELIIERQIKQLKAVGVNEIHIVVGYLKEQFDYLIDKYDVDIIVNPDYAIKNNLYSLYLAREFLFDCYVLPCDIWSANNPFCQYELSSWYMVSTDLSERSYVRVDSRGQLKRIKNSRGNSMIGISYLKSHNAKEVIESLEKLCSDSENISKYWEEALFKRNKMTIDARLVNSEDVKEINTYEDLREMDERSEDLFSRIIDIITEVMNVKPEEITGIEILKRGMTNRSFKFSCSNQTFIFRIPGEGTSSLINRDDESEVYKAIKDLDVSDEVVYFSPNEGYKITRYWFDARACDSNSVSDVAACMKYLRKFHEQNITVKHYFDLFEKIDYYESLWIDNKSAYVDYENTKKNLFLLKTIVDGIEKDIRLTHIDAVPDNFLFIEKGIRLIDWEYAAMQDPHLDIAMFAIYSLYDKKQVDELIDIYFQERCSDEVRLKIYCYVALGGLLWSNWCEYKRQCGVEFGEYALKQYRYAKDYYKHVVYMIKNPGKYNLNTERQGFYEY